MITTRARSWPAWTSHVPRVSRRSLLRFVLAPLLLGGYLAVLIDTSAVPGSGVERIFAVFLTDGESYFGHVSDDQPSSDTVVLSDVYYFQTTTPPANPGDAAQVALVRRGTEVHAPSDGMRIRRDKILGIERVGLQSAVARAMAVDRYIERSLSPR